MTSNDDIYCASPPKVDAELGLQPHTNSPIFSWSPEWSGCAPVSFCDIRNYAQSFDEEEFDETRTGFSEVLSNATESSPPFEPNSQTPYLTNDFVGEDLDIFLSDHTRPEDPMDWDSVTVLGDLLMPQVEVDTQWVIPGPHGRSGSHLQAIEDMSIGEPLVPATGTSQMSAEFGTREDIRADIYVQDGIAVPTVNEEVFLYQPPHIYSQYNDGDVRLRHQHTDPPPASHFLGIVPPVTVSPCSRPSSPPVNANFPSSTASPSPGSPRKRHHSESWSHSFSHRNSLTVDAPLKCFSPSPIPSKDPLCPRLIRTASSRIKKHSEKGKRRCQYCPDPSVWKPDQKILLVDLPPELLIEIFTFACSSLPVKRTRTCEHQKVGNQQSGLPRRSTLNGAFPGNHEATEQCKESESMLVDFYQRNFNLPRHLRLLQARTIRALQLTCRKFCYIFAEYPNVDNILWKEATIACWGHLPKTLAEVQGWNKTSQTCWRNVFGVFMRSDNGMFKRRNTGGVGGVESFGGKSGFKAAVLWTEEKKLRAEAKKFQEQAIATSSEGSTQGKGKQRQVDEINSAAELNTINRRKLLLVCPQPGPDVLTVKALSGEGGGYEIGLSLQNKETVFISLDEYGDFSNRNRILPHDLRRSKKGRFPPDCFEVVDDRMKVVKVERVKAFNHNFPDIYTLHDHHGAERMRRAMTWDLECVPEYANDKRASVARCEYQKEYLVFNMFASREGFIEGLDKPSEDSRVFCVMTEGTSPPAETPPVRAEGISKFKNWRPPWKGKAKVLSHDEKSIGSSNGPRTVFKWQRSFVHPRVQDYPISQGLHYMICNLKLNPTFAVLLIRWNIHSKVSYHEFVDRSFQVLDLATGATVKVLQFPNFHWDFRHHDMTVEYNVMRYYKMRRLFNAPHTGNRATRIHRDQFTLDDKGRLICGSHDYCNWMWDLNADVDEKKQNERVFTPLHNDAGKDDPFVVLDDFYWDGENQDKGKNSGAWNTHNERAGWWVKTPNQVLCFWHNVTTSKDGKWFAAVRAGRMFVWDLEDTTKVQGFSCALGTYMGQATENAIDAGKGITPASTHPTVETRYLGKLLNPKLEKKLKSWHVWNGIIPEQGLWLMYDDGKVVYLDRDDILDACGLRQEGKRWAFNRNDFGNIDTESEDAGDSINHEDDDDGSQSESDDDNALVFVDEGHTVPRTRRKRRRTSTMASSVSRSSSFLENNDGLVIDMPEQFMFDNELPDAETWEKMDDEGWLKRVKQEAGNDSGSGSGSGSWSGNPMEGSSGGG